MSEISKYRMTAGLMDKISGDIGFLLRDTVKWEVPKPKFLDFNYE